ncbi:bifunctional DNA primase/polymerase [Streptomyces sp. NPDC050625]|uniref:bifunctional DNA primase/polymerase n=1 Tax=Streptomyces sp. NPDC050625 TaxID=3154629 RepID=UPI00343CD18E
MACPPLLPHDSCGHRCSGGSLRRPRLARQRCALRGSGSPSSRAPRGKRPLTRSGFHDASTCGHRFRLVAAAPAANIGIPTGARSGLLVVDVDVHADGDGYDAFRRAQRAGLLSGWACLVRTPSGGLHAYYPATAEGEQRSWQSPANHVDFRGDGGYVIAPVDGHVIGSGRDSVNTRLMLGAGFGCAAGGRWLGRTSVS